MALVKCKECGQQISDAAKSCPACGAKPPKRTSFFTKAVAVFFGFSVIVSLVASNTASKHRDELAQAEAARVAALTPEQRAAEETERTRAAAAKIQDAKDKETRETRALATLMAIRDGLRNPDSVQWADVYATKDGSVICVKYRAQNGFGGMNLGYAAAVGNRIVTETDAYNRSCAGQGYFDMKSVASFYVQKTAQK